MSDGMSKDRQMVGLSGFPVIIRFNPDGFKVSFSGYLSVMVSIPENGMVDFSRIQGSILRHSKVDTKCLVSLCRSMVNDIDHEGVGTAGSAVGKAIIESPDGRIISAELSASWKNYGHPRGSFISVFEGFTACPCSMRSVGKLLQEKYDKYKDQIAELPGITHNQRVDFSVEMRSDDPIEHSIEHALKMAEVSLGNILSFNDSQKKTDIMIVDSHSNPRLIEDVLGRGREYSLYLLNNIPEITEIDLRLKSKESIHPYDAVASATVSR